MKRLGVLTGGGDCPGLNAVIRATTKTAWANGYEILGFLDGYNGLINSRYVVLEPKMISGILSKGGTILGTNNRDNPFNFPVTENGKTINRNMSGQTLENMRKLNLDGLIVIGGDGSLSIARELCDLGAKIVGVPKTIDNDLLATDQTFGFDTAVSTATDALDRLRTTAESHHRVMVLELMGRYAGWIALYSGIAGGADVILIPEIPWNIDKVISTILLRRKQGKSFSIVVVAEGTKGPQGDIVVKQRVENSAEPIRLGGIGELVGEMIRKSTDIETRVTVLGHIQRGGSPTAFDRILATNFGVRAAEEAINGHYGKMVCLRDQNITSVPLEEATKKMKAVPLSHPLISAARATRVCFGD